jgi:tellurium resistance protein TerD
MSKSLRVKYLLWIDEKDEGPYDKLQIVEMLSRSKITKETLCLPEDGNGDWKPIGSVPGLLDKDSHMATVIIRCQKCGESVEYEVGFEGQQICPSCRETVTLDDWSTQAPPGPSSLSVPARLDAVCAQPAQVDSVVRCPKCLSAQVTAIQKGFGTGGAVLGAVLLGPIGLLGGLIGSGKPKLACMKCGHTFQPGE